MPRFTAVDNGFKITLFTQPKARRESLFWSNINYPHRKRLQPSLNVGYIPYSIVTPRTNSHQLPRGLTQWQLKKKNPPASINSPLTELPTAENTTAKAIPPLYQLIPSPAGCDRGHEALNLRQFFRLYSERAVRKTEPQRLPPKTAPTSAQQAVTDTGFKAAIHPPSPYLNRPQKHP